MYDPDVRSAIKNSFNREGLHQFINANIPFCNILVEYFTQILCRFYEITKYETVK